MNSDSNHKSGESRPDFFFSYSTGEAANYLLSTLLWTIFRGSYDIRITPSALTSGASQLGKIEEEIRGSAFGVVSLDGLRPNVVYEWGHMRGCNKPVILLKTESATVDVRHFIRESTIDMKDPILDMNVHLSNLKDISYTRWFPDDPPKSAKAIWEEYKKLRADRSDAKLPEVEEPHLW